MDNLDKTIDALYDEPVYKDFINRKEFIRDTGIFVIPDFFKFIYEEFKDSGLAQQEFVETYEKSNLLYICTDKAGIIKYHLEDIIPIVNDEPDIIDILDELAKGSYANRMEAKALRKECKEIMSEYKQELLTHQQELLVAVPSNGIYA